MPSLPNLAILPPSAPEEALPKFNITDAALRDVSGIMAVPSRMREGDFNGELPPSITSLDDDTLGDLLAKANQWTAFVQFELAKADAARKGSEASLKWLQAAIRLTLKSDQITGKRLTVTEKDDIMTTHPQVVDAQSAVLFAEAKYQMIRAIYDKAQQNWDTVSRRITQRGQQVERIKRESAVGSIPAQPARSFRRPTGS
jgi:hypothetical protein